MSKNITYNVAIIISKTFEKYRGMVEKDNFFDDYVDLLTKGLQNAGFNYSFITLEKGLSETNWKKFDVALFNLAWDYHLNIDCFLTLLKKIENAGVKLLNSYETILWNIKKTYLIDLKNKGIKTTETAYVSRNKTASLRDIHSLPLSREFVLKPAISAAAHKTFRARSLQEAQMIYEAFFDPDELVMVQPFLEEILIEGEWSFMFFNGVYSHNVQKTADDGSFKVQYASQNTQYNSAEPWMISKATDILGATQKIIGEIPLYARIDVIRRKKELIVTEVELIEPYLYLFTDSDCQKFITTLEQKLAEEELDIMLPKIAVAH